MPISSDERRIAALLRELIMQSGTPADAVEVRLGWEEGRLNALLAQGVSFEVLLEVLPALDASPSDFFARLYSYAEADPYRGNGGGGAWGKGVPGGTAGRRRVRIVASRRAGGWSKLPWRGGLPGSRSAALVEPAGPNVKRAAPKSRPVSRVPSCRTAPYFRDCRCGSCSSRELRKRISSNA